MFRSHPKSTPKAEFQRLKICCGYTDTYIVTSQDAKKTIRGIPAIATSAAWKAAADGSLEQILEQKSRQARCCNSNAELIRSHFVMITNYVQESNMDAFLRNMDSSSRCFRDWARLESISFQTRAVGFVSLCNRFSDSDIIFDFLIFSLHERWWESFSCPSCRASGRTLHPVFRTRRFAREGTWNDKVVGFNNRTVQCTANSSKNSGMQHDAAKLLSLVVSTTGTALTSKSCIWYAYTADHNMISI